MRFKGKINGWFSRLLPRIAILFAFPCEGNVVNLRIFAKHLLVADGKASVSLLAAARSRSGSKSHSGFYSRPSRRFATQRGKVPPDFQIGKEADEVFLCKSILHVCKANLLLIHHKWSPPILESVPSQGKANKPYFSGNRQEFFLKLTTLPRRWRL